MMTRQLQFDILAAPLAAIDRRALSQAWYSALALSGGDAKHALQPWRSPATRAYLPESLPNHGSKQMRDGALPHGARPESLRARKLATPCIAQERRAPRSPLARRIESAFLDPRRKVKRTILSIGSRTARVHVLLAQNGDRMRLVALCPAKAREIVARALAQARFALASRGISLDVAEEGVRACS